MARPVPSDYPVFYESYIKLVSEEDLSETMRSSLAEMLDFLDSISPEKADYRYAEGKWSVKELLQHMIDTERIFSYRALCIARGEHQSLPGFDEKVYAQNADVGGRSLKELKEELLTVRESVYMMFRGFTDEMISRVGTSNNKQVSVNAIGYMIVGHVRHHFNILKERYL
jgi:DinB superfamily